MIIRLDSYTFAPSHSSNAASVEKQPAGLDAHQLSFDKDDTYSLGFAIFFITRPMSITGTDFQPFSPFLVLMCGVSRSSWWRGRESVDELSCLGLDAAQVAVKNKHEK
ncbi:hypothetical protein J3459_015052 [Metarhizium acridum]|nr:hypothetical protein J3459_015052 [Metarhizium acridum]